ncbi:MAG: methylmalonyl Co-A mutase-associated GTPase MeaB [Deltaproteobacteria bacterium]|nr:methylmalonyl Co-A mutase-associated GTPase MeaB [Deltaproteobacteria bacterium]
MNLLAMPRKLADNPKALADGLLLGDRRAAARAITLVEDGSQKGTELMKLLYPHVGRSMVIGVTGAGGSGKSSLINHIIRVFRSQGRRVGVVAVDPTSPFSGGALLGDRLRFQTHSMDEGVYIRSMASRGYLGGLARATTDVVRIIEAMGNDLVIVETLGAGQDEIDIIHVAQTCVLVLTPGMGDDIQAMKAGIMEIADLIALNKADLDGAETCLRSLEATVRYGFEEKEAAWIPRVIPTVAAGARTDDVRGIEEVAEAILAHQSYLRESRTIHEIQAKRVEQELGLVFRDEVQKAVFKGLKGTGKKRQYIRAILEGRTDPYSVVEEVLRTFLRV